MGRTARPEVLFKRVVITNSFHGSCIRRSGVMSTIHGESDQQKLDMRTLSEMYFSRMSILPNRSRFYAWSCCRRFCRP